MLIIRWPKPPRLYTRDVSSGMAASSFCNAVTISSVERFRSLRGTKVMLMLAEWCRCRHSHLCLFGFPYWQVPGTLSLINPSTPLGHFIGNFQQGSSGQAEGYKDIALIGGGNELCAEERIKAQADGENDYGDPTATSPGFARAFFNQAAVSLLLTCRAATSRSSMCFIIPFR